LQSAVANAGHAPRKAHHGCLLLTRGAPGSGDRASTSRYPLVSALSPVVGAPLTSSACARLPRDRVTFCFRKLDGAWQIVHDQASVPFGVLSGRGVADLEP
jgi:hypothetical protein